MAIRTATASVTLTDLTDGQSAVTAFLTNENHTFTANSSGNVADATRLVFRSEVKVFVGGVAQTFTTGTPTAGQYKIGTIPEVNGWEFLVAQANGTEISADPLVTVDAGVIYADAIGTPSSAVITIPVTYNTGVTTGTFNLDLTVSRTQDGAGATIVNLTPSSQTFTADSDGVMTASQNDSILTLEVTGSPGALSYKTSLDGAAFTAQTSTSDSAGGISGFDTNGTGTFSTGTIPTNLVTGSRLEISPSNIGTAKSSITVLVEGANAGKDAVTFSKIRAGKAAVYVDMRTNNPTIFRNNTGDPVTVTADVYDATNGNLLADGVGGVTIKYNWEFTSGADVYVGSADIELQTDASGTPLGVGGGRRLADGNASSGNVNTNEIIIGPSDIPDTGTPISIRCQVTVTTP